MPIDWNSVLSRVRVLVMLCVRFMDWITFLRIATARPVICDMLIGSVMVLS